MTKTYSIKRKLLAVIFILVSTNLISQTVILDEGFENATTSFTASGTVGWGKSSALKATGNYSDSTRIVNQNDSAILISPSFSTTGFSNVYLEFDQICKLSFFNDATIHVSVDNGSTWTQLTSVQYLGSAPFATTGNRFNAVSYIEWLAANSNAIPQNSWWKHELFDLSTLAANSPNVKIKFMAKDSYHFGGQGCYGWLLDNIKILASPGELIPPTVSLLEPMIPDTVFHNGPYDIKVKMNDLSGIDTAFVIYNYNSTTDTIGLSLIGFDTNNFQIRTAAIPSMPFNASFCYKVVVKDSSTNHNTSILPWTNCHSVLVKRPLDEIQVGLGGNSGFITPIFNDSAISQTKFSRSASLYTVQEMGFKAGNIVKVAWKKTNLTSYSPLNGQLKIYLKHLNSDTIGSDSAFYASQKLGATLVFNKNNVSLPASDSWVEFSFNIDSFAYNGSSNLLVLVEWYRPDTMSQNGMGWQFTTKASRAATFTRTVNGAWQTMGLGQLPNIKLFCIPTVYNHDIGVKQIIEPQSVVYGTGNHDVMLRVKNYGSDTIQKFNVHYIIDNQSTVTTPFTIDINPDLVTNTIAVGTTTYSTGAHTIKTWTSLPNDSLDQFRHNDSLIHQFYHCNSMLAGNYTVGGSSADFQDLAEVQEALNNCGVSQAVSFKINPGTYNWQINLNAIAGASTTNTITFTSASNNAADVKLQFQALGSDDNYIFKLNRTSHVIIKNLTLESTGLSYSTAISINDSSTNNTIENCKIISGEISGNHSRGVELLGNKNDFNKITGNHFVNCSYGVYAYGSVNFKIDGLAIENNNFDGMIRSAIGLTYFKNTSIKNNEISMKPTSTYFLAFDLYNAEATNIISANDFKLITTGQAKAMVINSFSGSSSAKSIISNNFISISGNSSSACLGIDLMNSSYISFLYNSISVSAGSTSSSAFYVNNYNANTGIELFNNVLSNFANGYCLDISSQAFTSNNISESDYNCYFSSGSIFVKYGFSNYITSTSGINGLMAATQKDSNSIFANPKFYTPTNLHSYSPNLDGNAISITSVTTDIDGQPRDPSNPDIGADEFTISSHDIGVVDVLNPLPVDTQNRTTSPKVVVRNFGSTTITNFTVKYKVGNATLNSYSYSGSITQGNTDTIILPSVQIPVLDFNFVAFTSLTNDTIGNNDSIILSCYGLPLIDLQVVQMIKPEDGCELTTAEPVKIKVKNTGLQPISSGATVSYKIIGNSSAVTESISSTILPGAYYEHNFATKANLSVTADSLFELKFFVNHPSDPIKTNDTIFDQVLSLFTLPAPIVSDTTIFYGNSASLVAVSPFDVKWFSNDTTNTPIFAGSIFTTPLLFDTTVYYAEANTNIPSLTVFSGIDQTTNAAGALPCPYGGNNETKQQYLILASELLDMGLVAGSEITSVGFYILSTSYNTIHYGYQVKIGHTSLSALTSNFITSGLTSVYTNNHTENAGWNIHGFSSPFAWNGTSNIVVEICNLMNYGNPMVAYSATSFNSVAYNQTYNACSATSGATTSVNRPNMRFTTNPVLGCTGIRVPVTVNVPLAPIDGNMAGLISPNTSCNLDTTQISCLIVNMGTDTIQPGFTAKYAIGQTFISPETINQPIAPGDTLVYTFATLANLPAGATGQFYDIKTVMNIVGDNYHANDTFAMNQYWSEYSAKKPIITANNQVSYGSNATLNATAIDTVYWFSDSLGLTALGSGNSLVYGPMYDTTTFYAYSQQTIPYSNYQAGTGTSTNTTSTGPTPYGAGSLKHSAKNQFLFRASELKLLGMKKGEIKSLAFYVTNSSGLILNNFNVAIGTTEMNELVGFDSNLTTVFSAATHTDIVGWNTYTFNSPFYWDGVSNLIVQTCFQNTTYGTFGRVQNTTTPFISSINFLATAGFSCSSMQTSNSYSVRPNIRFVARGYGDCPSEMQAFTINVVGIPSLDAGITEIVEPSGLTSLPQTSDVKVVLKNFGSSTLNTVNIKWKERGNTIHSYNWVGTLLPGSQDTVMLGSHNFKGGQTRIDAWTSLPNSISDTITLNDSTHVNLKFCMGGTYHIGQNTDYTLLSQAVNDLATSSACSQVVLLIDTGSYFDKIIIPSIVGINSSNQLIIKSVGEDSSTVTITANTPSTDNYVLKISSSSDVKIENLTFSSLGTTYANVIVVEGASKNVEIKGCVLNSSAAATSTGVACGILADDDDIRNLKIDNNLISNGFQGIFVRGVFAKRQSGTVISNNILNGFGKDGIFSDYTDSLLISGNVLSSAFGSSSCDGVEIRNVLSNFKLTRNKIVMTSSISNIGINTSGANGTVSNRSLIANNMISILQGVSANKGAYIYGSTNTDIAYNSFNINEGTSANYGVQFANGSGNRFVNNNIYSSKGRILEVLNPSVFSQCDYNNYFTDTIPNNYFVKWISDVNNISALKAIDINANVHSISTNPYFVQPSDLHSHEFSLNGSGIPITSVSIDYDGESRNSTTPDIGADEFDILPIDLGVVSLINPPASGCGFSSSDSIVVKIRNYGSSTINFATTNAQVVFRSTGNNPDTIIYTVNSGIIATGQYLGIKISNSFNLQMAGIYLFDAKITINGDNNNLNDSMPTMLFNSYLPISTLPFTEGFETGYSSQLGLSIGNETSAIIDGNAASTGNLGLHFLGGDNTSFLGTTLVQNAYALTDHVAKLYSCQVDATNLLSLNLRLDLKQTYYSNPNQSWFRVMIEDANGLHYLKNISGDSAFKATTQSSDAFVTQNFNLNDYTGQVFSLYLEAALGQTTMTNGQGDNVFIDNIELWSPSNTDIGLQTINSLADGYAKVGTTHIPKIVAQNFGYDTINKIPLKLFIDGNWQINDTLNVYLLPAQTDTFTLNQGFLVTSGLHDICIVASVANDTTQTNDSICGTLKGLEIFGLDYDDDFEQADKWFAKGSHDQWELGEPNSANFNSAFSGSNAWVTGLYANYQTSSTEYLYSPYFNMPSSTDSVFLEFMHYMNVVNSLAYGYLQYSVNNAAWINYGYIGMAGSSNWYNSSINGTHVWSLQNSGWIKAKTFIDPMFISPGSTVQFRFVFKSLAAASSLDGWMIDDFKISMPQQQIDAGVIDIFEPNPAMANAQNRVVISIKNFGTDTLTAIPVAYKLQGSSEIASLWTGVLLPDSVVNFVFGNLFTAPQTSFSICAYTKLLNDPIISNDSSCRQVQVIAPNLDAEVVSLSNVISNSTATITIKITNNGSITISQLPVFYRINSNMSATETITQAINQGDTISYTFQQHLVVPLGTYNICSKANLPGDTVHQNDEFCVLTSGFGQNANTNLSLLQNTPNPFQTSTIISYSVENQSDIRFEIVNMLGEIVFAEMHENVIGNFARGYDFSFLKPGVYTYSIECKGVKTQRKMIKF